MTTVETETTAAETEALQERLNAALRIFPKGTHLVALQSGDLIFNSSGTTCCLKYFRELTAPEVLLLETLYGVNLQSGVAGFGETPEKTMETFDAEWEKP